MVNVLSVTTSKENLMLKYKCSSKANTNYNNGGLMKFQFFTLIQWLLVVRDITKILSGLLNEVMLIIGV